MGFKVAARRVFGDGGYQVRSPSAASSPPPAGPPALVGTPGTPVYSAASVVTPTTLNPGTGTGYAIGDVLLCFTACRVKAPTVDETSDWTEIANVVGSTLCRLALYAKIADSTSVAAPTVEWSTLTTGTSGDPVCAMVAAFSGLNTSNIATIADVVGAPAQSANSTTLAGQGLAIVTTIDNDLVLQLAARTDDVANTWDRTGFTNVSGGAGAGASMLTTSGADMAAHWAYQIKTPAGTVSQTNFSISGGTIISSPSVGVHVALKPAGS